MSVQSIRDALGRERGFWPLVQQAMADLGFDDAYVEALPEVGRGGRPKHVKDKVWGMMDFEPDELAIIDCPLLQRLRGIKQLGLTYLTYPGAEHSRFVHTLGVATVVKRLVEAIGKVARRQPSLRSGTATYDYVDISHRDMELTVQSLVHAALLHDCGHLAFSHAGEGAFKAAVDLAKVGGMDLEDFVQVFREANFESDLSECLSITLCLSPRFRAFYRKVVGSRDVDRRIDELCSFMGGVPHAPDFPGLANIISGAAVDADKIDYINRDAAECGIPVGVDVSRVFLNSALIRITAPQADALSRGRGGGAGSGRFTAGTHFIVNSAGIDTYDELANAKSVLYQRVYTHQLTRNAEQVLSAALSQAMAAPSPPGGPDPSDLTSWFALGDAEFLAKLARDERSRRNATMITTRRLPKRAFALFRDACEPYVALQDVFDERNWSRAAGGSLQEVENSYFRRTSWRLFDKVVPLDQGDRPRKLNELAAEIRDEAVALRASLDAAPSGSRPLPYVGFAPRISLKAITEVLVREKNAIGQSGQFTKAEELMTADNVARGVDFVHADEDWLPYVTVACVKVFNRLNGPDAPEALGVVGEGAEAQSLSVLPRLHLRLDQVCSRVGREYEDVTRTMRQAARVGFFGAAERVVPLEPGQSNECREVADAFRRLSGEHGWHVTPRSVELFVRQFPCALRGEMVELLKGATLIGRGSVADALDALLADPSLAGGGRLAIGRFSPNSGAYTAMILEQERHNAYSARKHAFFRSLAELEGLLAAGGIARVIFVDDQFATGGQAHAQLLQWSGAPRDVWPEEIRRERNVDVSTLSGSVRTTFERGDVTLAFVFGTLTGKERVERAAEGVGFNGLKVAFASRIEPADTKMSSDMRAFLEDVGYELLRRVQVSDDGDAQAAEADLRRDSLGYGSVASFVITPFGAPSHAVTALWCPGIHRGQPWIPLFLRRGYAKDLVLG